MRKIRDVLRLNAEGLSKRKIAVSLGIGRTTIGDTVRRAQLAGLNWPLPPDLIDNAQLEQHPVPPDYLDTLDMVHGLRELAK